MSRFRWMLPLVVVLAANLPLRVTPAADRAPKPIKQPVFQGGPRMPGGELRQVESVLLMVSNSPLLLKEAPAEPGRSVYSYQGMEVVSRFSDPEEWLAAATPEAGKYSISFSPSSQTRGGNVLGYLSVYCREERPPAEVKKVVALAEKRLEQALIEIHKANMASVYERLRRAEDNLAQARALAEKRQSDLQSLRTRLIQFDASPEGTDQQQNTLRQDRLKLRVELVGLKARREAIVKTIEEATVKLRATSDEQQRELAELQKIVDIRVQAVSRAQQLYKTAAVSLSDVQQTELEVSRARADLAERRRVIAQQAGSEQLSRLNQQLGDVQIEMAAAEARVHSIDAMLDRLQSKDVLDLLREYGRTTQQFEYARAEEKSAFEQLAEVKKTAESAAPPKVVEIRGPQAPK